MQYYKLKVNFTVCLTLGASKDMKATEQQAVVMHKIVCANYFYKLPS